MDGFNEVAHKVLRRACLVVLTTVLGYSALMTSCVFGLGRSEPLAAGPESILRLGAYRREEFIDVSTKVLTEREGVTESFALACAVAATTAGSRDVRFAVRLARLARNEADVDPIVEAFGRHQ